MDVLPVNNIRISGITILHSKYKGQRSMINIITGNDCQGNE